MQVTSLQLNTTGVLYQNDSSTPLLVTVQAQGGFSVAQAGLQPQPLIFNSTANPADQAIVAPGSTGSRTYLIAPQQGIQVNAPSGGAIGFDVLIAPAA
jgi:hypothetical protein